MGVLVTELDLMDLRLAHALQVDGRASFTRIAAALGVSDQTVARRYARLRATGALRVVGLTDPDVTGHVQWFVRVRASPQSAQSIARALANRSDTSWVMLLAGGAEMVCTLLTDDGERADDLVLSALPRTSRVLDIQAYARLHQHFGSQYGAIEKRGSLTREEANAIGDRRVTQPRLAGDDGLDQIDRSIIAETALDGRVSIEHLSVVARAPQATVRRRLDSLRDRGILFFDVELDNRLLKRGIETVLWIKVEPSALHDVGTSIGHHPEVDFAAACTGPFALMAYVSTPDPASLYAYVTSSIAALPGVREIENTPVLKLLKGPGANLGPR